MPQRSAARAGSLFHGRRSQRVTAGVRVDYRVVGEPAVPPVPAAAPCRPGPRVRQAFATQVGGGGLLVETGERLLPGTRLSMTVYLPAPTLGADLIPLSCEARVVWTDIVSIEEADHYHCGVEFLEMDGEARAHLNAFIRACEATAGV